MATESSRYEPTPRKLADTRRRGEVPRSRELNGALILLAGLLSLWFSLQQLAATLKENIALVFNAIGHDSTNSLAIVQTCVFRCAFDLAPFIIVVFAVGIAASFLQVGPIFSLQAVFSRPLVFDSQKRLLRLFSGWQLFELLSVLLKLSVIGCIVWLTLKDGLRGVLDSIRGGLQTSITSISELTVVLAIRVITALLLFAIGDYIYQRYRFRKSQKMTHDELVREQREIYGDPLVRQRRDRIYREVTAHATLEEIAKALVVVYADTQIAVALRYQAETQEARAPEILMKGSNRLAQRILHTANLYSVPTVSDFPLAMTLYQLDIGREIPRDLYREVAAAIKSAITAQ